jgi:signal peptidase I
MTKHYWPVVRNLLLSVLLLFISVNLSRKYIVDVFHIPSESMEDQLMPEDQIVVNKLGFSSFSNAIGNHIQTGDILVFELNKNSKSYYVKRCIGLPGQKVSIENTVVKTNGIPFKESPHVILRFNIWYKSYSQLQALLDRLKIDYLSSGYKRNPQFLSIDLNWGNRKKLDEKKEIDSIKVDTTGNFAVQANKQLKSTFDRSNFSERVVPFKGMRIVLDERNFHWYGKLIHLYEEADIKKEATVFKLNGHPINDYTFKKSYLFLLGDNRNHSTDSRYFGFIPVANITGKYLFKF